MRMMRCKAVLTILVVATGVTEELWPGLEIDFDRELAPGVTVADAVRGRDDAAHFEPLAVEPSLVRSPAVEE